MSDLARVTAQVESTIESCEGSARWAGEVQADIRRELGALESVVGRAGESMLFSEALAVTDAAAVTVGKVSEAAEHAVSPCRTWISIHGSHTSHGGGGSPSAVNVAGLGGGRGSATPTGGAGGADAPPTNGSALPGQPDQRGAHIAQAQAALGDSSLDSLLAIGEQAWAAIERAPGWRAAREELQDAQAAYAAARLLYSKTASLADLHATFDAEDAMYAARESHRAARLSAIHETLDAIRPGFGAGAELDLDGGAPKHVADVRPACDFMPRDWIAASNDLGGLTIVSMPNNSRAYYDPAKSELHIHDDPSTTRHELVHRMEHSVPELIDREREFFERRTAGEDWAPIYPNADREEVREEIGKRDDFSEHYMGKGYPDVAGRTAGGREILSMGIQGLIDERYALDDEYRRFVLGCLLGVR